MTPARFPVVPPRAVRVGLHRAVYTNSVTCCCGSVTVFLGSTPGDLLLPLACYRAVCRSLAAGIRHRAHQ